MNIRKSLLIWVIVSLTVVMVVFYGVFLSKSKVTGWLSTGDNIFWTLSRRIPEELNVKIKNGEVSINKERPYCLLLEPKSGIGVYFSDSETPVLAKASECGALMTVGKNYVAIQEENGAYKVYKVDSKADYIINRSNIENFYQTNRPKIEKAIWISDYVGSWLIWLMIFGFGLLNCLWYSWVAKLALKIFQSKKNLEFSQIYGVVLFLMEMWWFFRYGLLYIIINIFFQKNVWFGFPFMNTIILTILALIWYRKWDEEKESKK